MIDTIRMFFPHARRHTIPDCWQVKIERRQRVSADGHRGVIESCTYWEKESGIRAFGNDREIQFVEVSLPRLLYGTNARLIKSQAELGQALRILHHKLNEIGERQTADYYYTRVDLVWQFQGDPQTFIAAHRNCKHRNIRKEQGWYEGQSLFWRGSELIVRMYDKVLEALGEPGSIVRVEAQLRGRRLKKELAGGADRLTGLDFEQCYRAYRNLMLGFCPAAVPKPSRWVQMLAIGQREGWQSNGVPMFDLWACGKSTKQVRRIQREMATLRATVHKIDWFALLPADRLPAIVEIEPDEFMRRWQ